MTVFLLLIVVASSADTPKSAVQHKNRFVHRRGRYEKREGQHTQNNTDGDIGKHARMNEAAAQAYEAKK